MDIKYLLLILLGLLINTLPTERPPRRLDSLEMDMNLITERVVATTETRIQKIEEISEEIPNMSYLTSTTRSTRTECKSNACMWTFYTKLDDGNRQVLLSFQNKNCYCKEGSTCEYSEDNPIASAFIHRCTSPKDEEED